MQALTCGCNTHGRGCLKQWQFFIFIFVFVVFAFAVVVFFSACVAFTAAAAVATAVRYRDWRQPQRYWQGRHQTAPGSLGPPGPGLSIVLCCSPASFKRGCCRRTLLAINSRVSQPFVCNVQTNKQTVYQKRSSEVRTHQHKFHKAE